MSAKTSRNYSTYSKSATSTYEDGTFASISRPIQTKESGAIRISSAESQSLEHSGITSCTHVLSIVITMLYHTVNHYHEYKETLADSLATRKAKLLYVALLERIQRERGEWCGFEDDDRDEQKDQEQEQEQQPQEQHERSWRKLQAKKQTAKQNKKKSNCSTD